MKKRMFLCLTALLLMVSSLSAQMFFWQNNKQILAADPELVDSLTFQQRDLVDITFTFALQDARHILITPSRNDIDYIWVAVSDADYAYYQYASYQEAWQYTVDKAQQAGALDEWEMIDRGPSVVDLTDNTWNNDHYRLVLAAWDGEMENSAFSFCDFTFTNDGVVLPAATAAAALSPAAASADKLTAVQFWQKGEVAKSLALNRIDSVTFPQFSLTVTDITNTSFLASVTPVDDKMYYYVDYVHKSIVDGYTDYEFAQAYMVQLLDYWKIYYPTMSFADAFLYQGAKTLRFSDGVMGNTDYYLVCFAVDVADNTLASTLYKVPFKTEPTPSNPDLTFTVTVNERYVATITPSDDTSTYYWGYYSEGDARRAGSPEDAWKADVAVYGNTHSVHGKASLSLTWQAYQGAGKYYLVIGGYDGEITTPVYVWEYDITESMSPL